ncbi:MAG: DUF99 family protein [Promethearchaeota archaeon]|nr:MAG: DUF99 family protein [Candidatus Lokiarchaeota archaeon]
MMFTIKNGIHVVAIDDSPHHKGDTSTEVFFVYCKSTFLEYVTRTTITVDGIDATQKILEELQKNQDNFNLILLHGISVGGLNIVDIRTISQTLQKPLLAITENPPTAGAIYSAIQKVDNSDLREILVDQAGPMLPFSTTHGFKPIYISCQNIDEKLVERFLKKFCIRSRLPEQLLLAHKIASAWK